jgi:transcriptional regulator of NAD metabolism
MSKIFYDQLINLEDIEKEINSLAESNEEKEELWNIVDEIVHHRVMGCILDNLDTEDHEEFLIKFHKTPYDESLFDYLKEKIDKNLQELIQQEIGSLSFELIRTLKNDS